MTDDAHGIGVVGGGRGSSFVGGAKVDVPLQMGTLSKAVGSYGGYLCASQPVIDLIRTRARPFIYSTGLPPGVVAASIAALDLIANAPDLVAAPLRKASLFCARLNLPAPESCIVPILLGAPERALAASRLLEGRGLSRNGDPAADGAGGHGAAPPHLQCPPRRRRHRTAGRDRARAHPRPGRTMSKLFVTATGTEIGKTLVAAALCHEFRAAGRRVRALKPVLSGYDPARLAESDPGILLASLGEAVTEEAVADITPWRFSAPLSPDMAAAREGRRLDLADIVAFCRAGRGRPSAGRGHRRRHGAAQRRPHRARLDRGTRRAGTGGDGQLPRHHQPHADHARRHSRGAASPSPDWSSANRRKARCPRRRRRKPSPGTPGHCRSKSCPAFPPTPRPGARPRPSPVRWTS